MASLLEVRGVAKRFAANDVQAVAAADLTLETGQIHAVVGENGAGKSTLMQIIAGVVPADSGTVSVSGRRLQNGDAHAALAAGIVMSYQHPRLDRALTVLENLFLGEEPLRFGIFFDATAARERVRVVAPDFSPALLSRRLGSLSSGQIRMVSLVAALLRLPDDRPGVLILDEPTEATTPTEAEHVFTVIRQSADSGHAVVFISHKLPEVERIADAVTVLRAGRTVASWNERIGVDRLAREMVGGADTHLVTVGAADLEAPSASAAPAASEAAADTAPLRIERLTARDGRRLLLDDITLSVRPGEIVGVTGIRENGIEAMESLLAGKLQADAGVFEVVGHDATGLSPGRLRKLGLRYVPTDRLLRGASVESSVAENLIALKRRNLQKLGMLDSTEVSQFASKLHENYGIEGNLQIPLWQLSGGNIQKVILSRELEGNPRLLVICEPSWGLDFRSRASIVERIRASARAGAAVLVLTTDIDEVLDLSSRIAVLFDARIAALFDRDEASRELIGRAMAGASEVPRGA